MKQNPGWLNSSAPSAQPAAEIKLPFEARKPVPSRSLPANIGHGASSKKSYVLTFLAPAKRCNQKCPKCFISEIRHELASSFSLKPDDYVKFVEDFLHANKTILTLCFQGYEVTLPQSWPYVEALFRFGKANGIRRSFITNGMLLHKYTRCIVDLDPARISVSLDGADAATNDVHRGLRGAFDITTSSVGKFLEAAPEFHQRLTIVSVLFGKANFNSLLQMPALIQRLGLKNWGVGIEVESDDTGALRYAANQVEILGMIRQLKDAATTAGIGFYVTDELQMLKGDCVDELNIMQVPQSMELVRLLPSGHIYWGADAFKDQANADDVIWDPTTSAVDFICEPDAPESGMSYSPDAA